MSKTVVIQSPAEYSQIINNSTIVVTDFYADWCGPCKIIAPVYEQLSAQLSVPNKITFTKVNTDVQTEIAQSYGVNTIPTFIIFKNGKETDRIQGANAKKLQAAVQKLATEAQGMSAAGEGSSGSAKWLGSDLPRGYSDVTDQVDIKGLDLLNADSDKGNARTLFDLSTPAGLNAKGKEKKDEGKIDWVESDTDDQLMLFVPFQATLKIHTMYITSLPPADDEETMRPKTLKLFINHSNNLGFEDATDGLEPTQTVTLSESDWQEETGTAKIELRFVRFQKVSTLVVFIENGEGSGEKVRLDRIRLIGESGEKKAMGQLQKIGDEQGE